MQTFVVAYRWLIQCVNNSVSQWAISLEISDWMDVWINGQNVDTDIDSTPQELKNYGVEYIQYIPPIISMYGYTCSTFHELWKQICDYTITYNIINWSVDVSVCRHFGLSTYWFVDVSVCRHIGLSTFRFVDILVCRCWGLSTFRFVDVLVCQRFGCRRFGLSTFWPVTIWTPTNLINSVKFETLYKSFYLKKYISKCCLSNGGHFVLASMSWTIAMKPVGSIYRSVSHIGYQWHC